jgi:2-polyprenyl-6-methoxyphenol hydroxylase-like FAD-dependent oxidoreductase
LIGCDGSHSAVRHLLGMRLEGSFVGQRFHLGDVEADYDLERGAMHAFFGSDGGPLLVFPMLGDRVRLIAEAGDDDTVSLDVLHGLADRFGVDMKLRSAHWLTTFEIHHGQVPRYRSGRAFLAGDAAHIHSPAGGQGMNTGIQDAFNLAWKLAVDHPSEALLDSYHAERHPVAERVIEVTTAVTRAGTIEHPLVRRLRNKVMGVAVGLAPIADRIAAETEETALNYRRSPIVAGRRFGRGPHPGDIAPVVGVQPDGHTVLEVGSVVPDPRDAYGFGATGGTAVIRPDGYIGLLAARGDAQAVDAYFGRIEKH